MIFVLILAAIFIGMVVYGIANNDPDTTCDKTQCHTCPYRCNENN